MLRSMEAIDFNPAVRHTVPLFMHILQTQLEAALHASAELAGLAAALAAAQRRCPAAGQPLTGTAGSALAQQQPAPAGRSSLAQQHLTLYRQRHHGWGTASAAAAAVW